MYWHQGLQGMTCMFAHGRGPTWCPIYISGTWQGLVSVLLDPSSAAVTSIRHMCTVCKPFTGHAFATAWGICGFGRQLCGILLLRLPPHE